MKKFLFLLLSLYSIIGYGQTQYTVLNNATPAGSVISEQGASTVGIKFRANQTGYIIGVKFYKGVNSSGRHVAALWSGFNVSGTLTDSIVFSGETASGWQTQYFSSPRLITSGADYMASVSFEDVGGDTYWFEEAGKYTSAFANGPLTVVANGGCYDYGAGWLRPNASTDVNFFVDVIFQTSLGSSNAPPTANAGSDKVVTTPNTFTFLNGLSSDVDGTIASRLWTKLSGPTGGTILNATSDTTTVNALSTGIYNYELSATDNLGAIGRDTVVVYVNQNILPLVNAGIDRAIVTNNVTLTGSATDGDGTISTYAWTKISGPTCTITSPSSATTTVTGMNTLGNYVFRLTATDNSGGTAFDEVTIQVTDGSSVTFTPTVIPFSNDDIISPFRGAERWHLSTAGQSVSNPNESTFTPPLDVYHRSSLAWDELESSQGVYTWTYFDQVFNDAITNKQRISFGVMTQNPGRTDGPFAGGAYMSYPLYLHNLMQSEVANQRDWISAEDAFWIPNYNSVNYLSRFEALMNAIAAHVNSTSFNGVRYSDVLSYLDIRGYGSWGEWNMVSAASTVAAYPTGRRPLAASLIRIVNAHLTAFPNIPQVAMIAAFDGNQLGNVMVPPEVGHHILTASNTWGKIGWRRDSWGWTDGYFRSWTDQNPTVYNGVAFDTAIMNRWKYAPILGEGPCGGTANGGPCPFWVIPQQVRDYHVSMIGNGNFCDENNVSVRGRDSMRLAWKLSGYRIELSSVTTSGIINNGQPLSITAGWKNVGIAPVYEDWQVTYELQDQTTGVVGWSGNSSRVLRGFLPTTTAANTTDNFTLPISITPGTYRLVVKIKDPKGYRDPFPLAITNRRSDGSYQIRQDIVITTVGSNTSPTTNAGTDQTITLPTSSVTVTGSATDIDGTIASYLWTKVSGTGGVIVSPSSASTSITGLSAGVYVFRLTATDNVGAATSDDIQVTVNAAANAAPTVNAGSDQVLTLPINSTSLSSSATDTDGTIASYVWTKVSGTGGSITTPNAATTTITGLSVGTYVYRITVTDNGGLTATDNVNIVVNAQPNQVPSVGAGSDQTITLPTNSVTVTGTATDSDGSITAYLWTKISGPTGGTITSPTTISTTITALTVGTYTYRLTATDNSGATATDFVNIVVNPAPVGTAYVASITKTWGTEIPTPRLRVRISFTDGITQIISTRNGAYVIGVRARYKFLEGGNRLVVIINYSDYTVQQIYKK